MNDEGVNPQKIRKWLEISEETDIGDILPLIFAKGLAIWQDDPLGGKVVGSYKNSGRLRNGNSYLVLSGNIQKTIEALDKL